VSNGNETDERLRSNINIRIIQKEDLNTIDKILRQWLINKVTHRSLPQYYQFRDEIEQSLRNQNNFIYLVAEDNSHRVVGIIGIRNIGEELKQFVQTDSPIEFENVLVDKGYLYRGIGSQMVSYAENFVREEGYKRGSFKKWLCI
jgi:predicted N-acetyltransferase YhbS